MSVACFFLFGCLLVDFKDLFAYYNYESFNNVIFFLNQSFDSILIFINAVAARCLTSGDRIKIRDLEGYRELSNSELF